MLLTNCGLIAFSDYLFVSDNNVLVYKHGVSGGTRTPAWNRMFSNYFITNFPQKCAGEKFFLKISVFGEDMEKNLRFRPTFCPTL